VNYTRYQIDDKGTAILSESVEYEPPAILAEQAGAAAYAKDIRGIARAVWQNLPIYAYATMWDVVGLGITAAWRQGAATCGISEDELSLEEKTRRDEIITEQRSYVPGFLDWVYAHRRDGPDKLLWRQILPRTVLWANAWNKAQNISMTMACGNQKLMWVLGPTKEHCHDCSRLDGKVKRASQWEASGWQPQGSMLTCGGWRCLCDLVITDAPLSKGYLPRVR